jgi:hypothetical protein
VMQVKAVTLNHVLLQHIVYNFFLLDLSEYWTRSVEHSPL